MILTCPACGTRYAVKDGAIPEGGRQVRCASCKNSWHQNPEGTEQGSAGPAEAPVQDTPEQVHPAGEPAGKPAMAALGDHAHPDLPADTQDYHPDPDAHPLPDPGAAELIAPQEPLDTPVDEVAAPEPEPIVGTSGPADTAPDDGWSDTREDVRAEEEFPAYAPAEDAEPQRRRGLIGLLLALLLIAALVAAFWFLAPTEWKERLGIAQGSTSAVMVQLDETNRRTLASGNELLEVTGKVINPTDQPQRVPQIEAMLRTYGQKVVYRWTIPPPAAVLAPGGSATFNSAELLSIPADAACLSVLALDTDHAKLEPCTPASQQVAAQPS